jgi:hypothetical protein
MLESASGSGQCKFWILHGLLAGAAVAAATVGFRLVARSNRACNRVVGIIPAHFRSTRFEGKPLVEILDKPMIQVWIDFNYKRSVGSVWLNVNFGELQLNSCQNHPALPILTFILF